MAFSKFSALSPLILLTKALAKITCVSVHSLGNESNVLTFKASLQVAIAFSKFSALSPLILLL